MHNKNRNVEIETVIMPKDASVWMILELKLRSKHEKGKERICRAVWLRNQGVDETCVDVN